MRNTRKKKPMLVLTTYPTDKDGRSIEFGLSTYDKETPAMRIRYTNSAGRFNPKSPEIFLRDQVMAIRIAAHGDEFAVADLALMIEAMAASLSRQIK